METIKKIDLSKCKSPQQRACKKYGFFQWRSEAEKIRPDGLLIKQTDPYNYDLFEFISDGEEIAELRWNLTATQLSNFVSLMNYKRNKKTDSTILLLQSYGFSPEKLWADLKKCHISSESVAALIGGLKRGVVLKHFSEYKS